MVYQDYPTKYVLLKPLKTKRPEEVRSHILEILSFWGFSNILYSDEERESNQHNYRKSTRYMKLKVVHG